jgi:hypothetical protein
MYSNYKLALLLHKTYNFCLPEEEWIALIFLQTLMSRQVFFHVNRSNNTWVGMNTLCNRFINLYEKIPLQWFNKSLLSFKLDCKNNFLKFWLYINVCNNQSNNFMIDYYFFIVIWYYSEINLIDHHQKVLALLCNLCWPFFFIFFFYRNALWILNRNHILIKINFTKCVPKPLHFHQTALFTKLPVPMYFFHKVLLLPKLETAIYYLFCTPSSVNNLKRSKINFSNKAIQKCSVHVLFQGPDSNHNPSWAKVSSLSTQPHTHP